jgi:topoisomerase IV subunit A
VYANWAEGFIGSGLKKDEYIFECNDADLIIAFTRDGNMRIAKVADKVFFGKDIIQAEVFRKNDDRTTYNMVYMDGKTGISFAKRFNVTGITMNKEYALTKGNPKSKVHYFTSNANGESEIITINLRECKAKIKNWDFDFAEIAIKGRSSNGNILTKYPIKSIKQKSKGKSTLGGKEIWYDDVVGRLNADEKGMYLGSFNEDNKIIVVYNDGNYEITNFEFSNRYDTEKVVLIEKFKPEAIISLIYFDADKAQYNAKRFKIETTTLGSKFAIIKEGEGNYVEWVTTHPNPEINIKTGKKKSDATIENMLLAESIDITGWKTVGTKIAGKDLLEIESLTYAEIDDDKKQLRLL